MIVPSSPVSAVGNAVGRAFDRIGAIPDGVMVLMARIALAGFFFRSGLTKISGFSIAPSTYALFAEDYRVPLLPSEAAAWLATGAELLCPILLVIGLGTRLAALALLGMTAVIQIFVYPASWPDHLLWATALLLILARGPGPFALDHTLALSLKARWLRTGIKSK